MANDGKVPSRVVLLPTGAMEHRALATSLKRAFSGVEFVTLPPDRPLDGFTSSRLILPLPPGNTTAQRLARRLVAECCGPNASALVAVVDDLELANANQPKVVVDAFGAAVRAVFDEVEARAGQSERQACMAAVKARGSLHLMVPMTEAYYYGDPNALAVAGAVHAPQLKAARGIEDFETDDAAYVASANDPNWAQAAWLHDKAKRRSRNHTLLPRHPKRYLEWLARDTTKKGKTSYQESKSGVTALASLDWATVVAGRVPASFAGALLCDIADAVGVNPPRGVVATGPTARRRRSKRRALRNW